MKAFAVFVAVLTFVACNEAASECRWGPSYWCQDRTTAQLCGQLKYCQENVWKASLSAHKPKLSSSLMDDCSVCKMIAGILKTYVDNNKTENDAKNEVKEVCDLIPGVSSECDDLVDKNFDQIWQYLMNEVSPDEICKVLGLCSSGQTAVSGVFCEICELVIYLVRDVVFTSKTENDVKVLVKEVCTVFGDLQSECDSLIDSYWDTIWKLIEQEVEPTTICPLLIKGCSGITTEVLQPNDEVCSLCEEFLGFFKTYVDNTTTENMIKTTLEGYCSSLGALKDECVSLIDQYLPMVWMLAESYVDNPNQTCTELKLCSSASSAALTKLVLLPRQQLRKQIPEPEKCDLCKSVAGILKPIVDSNTIQADVKKYLMDICNLLPSNVSSECNSLITKYFHMAWALVEIYLDNPGDLCEMVGLCNSTTARIQMPKQGLCDICKLVVSFLEPYVNNNSTEQEAEKALEGLCNILPSSISSECDSLVEQYFPLIWQLVQSEFSNDEICMQLGLCNSTTKARAAGRVSLRAKLHQMPKQGLCDICKLVVSFLEPYVNNNSTEQEAEKALEGLCNILPSSISSECDSLVEQYFPLIWQLVQSEFSNDEICMQLGLCNSTTKARAAGHVSLRAKLQMPKQGLCDICKLVVSFLEPYVNNNSTEQEAEKAIEGLCNILPSSISSECDSLVEQYFPLIWQLVQSEFSNDEICMQLGLCNSTTKARAVSFHAKPQMPKQGLCDICKLVVSFLGPYVDNNATEQEAEKALEGLCNILPSSISSTCDSLVEQYFPLIWQLVQSEFSNDEICMQLGLCNSTTKARAVSLHAKPQMPKQGLCDICKLVVSFLGPYVDNNATEQEAEKALEGLCNILPSSISSTCDSLVEQYFPLIWQLVQSEFSNDEICMQLGLCNSTTKARAVSLHAKPQMPKQGLCDICKLVVSFLGPYVDNNATEQEAEKALEGLCNILPSSISSTCDSLVEQYFPLIWQLVQSEFSNDEICMQLGLCNSTTKARAVSLHAKPQMPKQGLCDICKLVVSFLGPYVDNNATEQEAEKALEGLCNILPSSISSTCDSLVEQYFPLIWQLVQSEFSNDEICMQLGLCNSTTRARAASRVSLRAKLQSNIRNDSMYKVALLCYLKCVNGFLDPRGSLSSAIPAQAIAEADMEMQKQLKAWLEMPKQSLCDICKLVVNFLQPYVDNNATEKEVEQALEGLCNLLPSNISQQCDSLVEQYVPVISQLVKSEVDNDEICIQLGLCNSTVTTVGPVSLMAKPQSPEAGVLCVLCEFVMKKLESILVNNATEGEIEAALDKVCGLLPSTISKDCDEFVNEYAPAIINLLLQKVGPNAVCTLLKLCIASETAVQSSVKGSTTTTCTVCTDVLSFVKTLVGDKTTQGEVEQVLKYVCGLMPSGITTECTDFVEAFGPELIQLIDDEIDPTIICKKLGLCTSALMHPWTKLLRAN